MTIIIIVRMIKGFLPDGEQNTLYRPQNFSGNLFYPQGGSYHVEKNIPIGSGLAARVGNAATVLKSSPRCGAFQSLTENLVVGRS